MGTPKRVVWDRDPHTGAKHDVLRRYLAAWLPILFTRYPHVTYAEGFAGPGVYTHDEPGSPVIALEVINAHRDLIAAHPRRSVDVLFVEEDSRRRDRLEQELTRAQNRLGVLSANVRVHPPICGDCVHELPRLFTELSAWGAPMLVVLDSWGGPDVPFDLVQSIAANPSGEALVTFGPTFLTRHGEDPSHAESGDAAFGGQEWRGVFEQPADRKWAFLLEAYRASLHKAGFTYVLSFEMIDERGSRLWLMFGTNSTKGVEKMKDSLWAVDPAYGVRYRDPRDPSQMTLDIKTEPDTAPLARMLLDALQTGSRTLDELREYALLETVYRSGQVRAVTQQLLTDQRITQTTKGRLSRTTVLELAPGHAADEVTQPPLF